MTHLRLILKVCTQGKKSHHSMPGMFFRVSEPVHLINNAIPSIHYFPSYLYAEHHLIVTHELPGPYVPVLHL